MNLTLFISARFIVVFSTSTIFIMTFLERGDKTMKTNNQNIKYLKKQNDILRKQNQKLRNQISTQEYAIKLKHSLDRFDRINDDLIQLYHDLHHNHLRHKHIYWKYQLMILWIKLKKRYRS